MAKWSVPEGVTKKKQGIQDRKTKGTCASSKGKEAGGYK